MLDSLFCLLTHLPEAGCEAPLQTQEQRTANWKHIPSAAACTQARQCLCPRGGSPELGLGILPGARATLSSSVKLWET